MRTSSKWITAITVAVVVLLVACGDDGGDTGATPTESDETAGGAGDTAEDGVSDEGGPDAESSQAEEPTPAAVKPETTVRLLTHDSFSVSDGLFDQFTLDTGIDVEVVKGGDAGELVSRAILTAGEPEADVLFGVDNTFLQRALDAELFEPYTSTALDSIPDQFELDPEQRVTPVDYGDVCVNYWTSEVDGEVPTGIDDLAEPEYAAQFVTMDPEASSPGFAFLLATIAKYGEDGWQEYWRRLADGGVAVTSGWSDAYYGEFIPGGGDRSIVTSYATSPVAEMIFATVDYDEPPTGVLTDGCFRQIEFAGVLAGTDSPEGAGALIDFLVGPEFQADIPLNMFVFPVNENVPAPDAFEQWATTVDNPLTLDPVEIEANRSRWTEEWAEIVLR